MNKQNDNILVENARKAVAVELSSNSALGYYVCGFDSKTKTVYNKLPNGKKVNIAISNRGRYSEHKK